MRETEIPRLDEQTKEQVALEVGKAMSLFAEYVRQDWKSHFAEPVEGSDPVAIIQGPSVEPFERGRPAASPSPSEPAPWETISSDSQQSGKIPTEVSTNGEIKDKQPKVRVTGNLVHDPTVARTKTGQPLVRFSIGEHPEPGQTVYHKAYSTNRYAEWIEAEGLTKGELVTVVGSEQRHVKIGRDKKPVTREGGEIVEETVIYAYAVKRVS